MRDSRGRPEDLRRESDARARRAYELVERGLAELDIQRGRTPRPWREVEKDVLGRVYREAGRPSAS